MWYNGGMATKVNRNSKSILAKVLACENITVRHCNTAHTATFDIRNRVLTLPLFDENMSNELYDMLVAHEVGHALFTPFSEEDEKSVLVGGMGKAADKIGGKDGYHVAFGYLNVVEDARIDRLMRDKFAGIRRDYHIGYRELHERDFFKIMGKNANDLSLIDRINLYFKIGSILTPQIEFNEEEKKFINRIESATTYDDVVAIVTDLWSYCKENPESTQEKTPVQTEEMDTDLKTNAGADQEEIDNSNFLTVDSSKMNEMDQTSSTSFEETNEKPEDDKNITNGISTKVDHVKGKLPSECETQQAFESAKNTLLDIHSTATYNYLPSLNFDSAIIEYSKILEMFNESRSMTPTQYENADAAYRSFEKTSKNSVNILIKQFMMKKAANESSRATVSKTGTIDTNRLVDYKFTEDIFLRVKNVKKGKSHGLVMFMDWSGSMSSIMEDTLKQLFQICLFCRKINIPFKVYAFTSLISPENYRDYYSEDPNARNSKIWNGVTETTKNCIMSDFQLLEMFSSEMTNIEFNQMMGNMFAFINEGATRRDRYSYQYPHIPSLIRLSGTPLNEAIVAAMDIIPRFKSKNNLDIVHTVFLTDGEANGSYFYGSSRYSRGYIVRGKNTYEMDNNMNSTDSLVQILTDICNCKAIGIFLDSRKKGDMSSYTTTRYFRYSGFDEMAKANKSYNDEGFAIADRKTHGYTELFIVRGNSSIDDDDVSEVLQNKKTNTAIRNAFIKTMDNRTTSRIMLNRFIDLISTE